MSFPDNVRYFSMLRAENRCECRTNSCYCNKDITGRCSNDFNLETHHIIPVEEGGVDGISNCLILCKPCHEKIHEEL